MHRVRHTLFTVLFLTLAVSAVFCQEPPLTTTPAADRTASPTFFLKNGDRVAFYGDSITAQRLYTNQVEDFVLTRYPSLNITFFNAGVSGDMVTGGRAGKMKTRVDRDLLPDRPTVVTIMLGMNDGRYTTAFKSNFATYAAGYRKLLDRIKDKLPNARITLIEPSPYDEISRPSKIPGYNDVLLRYGQFVATTAQQQGMQVVDFNHPLTQALRVGMLLNPSLASLLIPDHIHPSESGHWIMAAALMRAWGASPIVSSVSLDGMNATLQNAQNTDVTALKKTATGLSWEQEDMALPLPLYLSDPMTQFLLKISDLATLDQQMLRVQHLRAASYTLTIDDRKVASFTRQELADGVNLALYETPMLHQAWKVDDDTDNQAALDRAHFLLITTRQQSPDVAAAAGIVQSLEYEMAAEQHEDAQPKLHAFELAAN